MVDNIKTAVLPVPEFNWMEALPKTDCYEYTQDINGLEGKTYTTQTIVNGIRVAEGEISTPKNSRAEAVESTRLWLEWAKDSFEIVVRIMPEYMVLGHQHYIRMRVVLIPKRDLR